MVSSRSPTRRCKDSSNTSTGTALVRRRGSGYSNIVSFVMGVMRWISCFRPKIVAKVPPLLNLMLVAAGRKTSFNPPKTGDTSQSLGPGRQYTSRPGNIGCGLNGSERMQRQRSIALLLAIAAVAGCHTQPPPAPPPRPAAADNDIQGTAVGDERTAMEAAVDSGSG